jgi:hypothetical protein
MTPPISPAEPLRLAVFGTPRSGNTWFRALLKSALALTDFAEHDPAEVPWHALPERAVVNLHAVPSDGLRAVLGDARPVVIARHPLDALVSVLHFAPHHGQSNRWLLGAGGTEDGIRTAVPTDPAFREYAVGPRAAALLSVSARWWHEPGAVRVRYEDLVADTAGELARVLAAVGAEPARPLDEVAAEHTLAALRTSGRAAQHHMWQGRPGLWRRLLPADLARAVAAAHPEAFDPLGYACDPDESLTDAEAAANWLALLDETDRRDTAELWKVIDALRAGVAAAAPPPAAEPEPDPERVDLRFDGPLPGAGFHGPDAYPGGCFRWTERAAWLDLRAAADGEVWVTFEVVAHLDAGQLDGLRLAVNGRPVRLTRAWVRGAHRFAGLAPAAPDGRYWLDLRVPRTFRPCDTSGNGDDRELGVGIARLELFPAVARAAAA